MLFRSMQSKVLFVVLVLASLFSRLGAQVPLILNHQGRVAVGGVPCNGTGQFKFALVNGDGSQVYWRNAVDTFPADGQPDTAVSVSVSKGLYSVGLGDTAVMLALDASMLAHPEVRLRVWFNDGVTGFQQLAPDQRLGSVAYALMAKSAETATSVATPPGMVYIPGGAFTMGRTSGDTDANAVPVSVTASPFYMDMYEVRWSQWRSVYFWATNHGYSLAVGAGKAPNHPVQRVNWYDVVKWCNARSEQAGKTPVYYTDPGLTAVYRDGEVDDVYADWSAKGYRLPTEAEWEKAARGGVSGQRFPWGDQISQDLANSYGATGIWSYDFGPDGYHPLGNYSWTSPATTPVGTCSPNLYGLYDMEGNVCEWCWDWFDTPYAGGTAPHGPVSGYTRVIRGGSWGLKPACSRSASRIDDFPDSRTI
mgnify:CR=1 FL=1